ncbi:beta-galactoside alpha-2,6-sialyltransferase 2-like [Ptychodera flava]|uniref:beta-galactoside alpha-2,6-sialyltransferase 2-like n=1 Tax=Ptychodera flava TaxID=63121 RepID=UPI003969BC83
MSITRLKISVFALISITVVTFIVMNKQLRAPVRLMEGIRRQHDITRLRKGDLDGVFTSYLRSNLSIPEVEDAVRSGRFPLEKASSLLKSMKHLVFHLEKYLNCTDQNNTIPCQHDKRSGDALPMKSSITQANKSKAGKFIFVRGSNSTVYISKITLPDPKNPAIQNVFKSYDKKFDNSLMRKSNTEGIRYSGPSKRFRGSMKVTDVMCRMKKMNVVKTLTNDTSPFNEIGISKHFPERTFTETYKFSKCAVVGSSFHLNQSGLGEAIDNHDAVLRFNDAPTVGFEKDVGKRTTFRVVNSRAFAKMCGEAPSFCPAVNETLLIWRTGPYNGNLYRWYIHALGQALFSKYLAWRTAFPSQDIYLIHPQSLWLEWDTLAFFNTVRVKPIVPSSGFTGIALLLGICDRVDVYGYVNDKLPNYSCHYYNPRTSCKPAGSGTLLQRRRLSSKLPI